MTTSALVKTSPAGLHCKAYHRSQIFSCNQRLYFSLTRQPIGGLLRLSTSNTTQRDSKRRRNFSVYCSDQPELLGLLNPPLMPEQVENTLHTAEHLVEAVEKAAEEVEKVVEHIADDVPEGTKLKSALNAVEHLAEATVDNAHTLENLIEKVEEMEEKMESMVESALEETKETAGKSNVHK